MMMKRHRVQWINVRNEMAAHAIGVDEFEDARLLDNLRAHVIAAKQSRIVVRRPTHWRIRDFEIGKDVVVEMLFADQQLMHAREERAGFRTLYDAMIVSG